jgi:hypothetical protein
MGTTVQVSRPVVLGRKRSYKKPNSSNICSMSKVFKPFYFLRILGFSTARGEVNITEKFWESMRQLVHFKNSVLRASKLLSQSPIQ